MRSYFVRRLLGTPYSHYFVIDDAVGAVVRIQISRPDGVEIGEPKHVRISASEKARPAARAEKTRDINPPIEHLKRCPHCKLRLAREAFSALATGRLASWCRECNNNFRRVRRGETA
jgi:hypothetical protein